MASGKEQPAAPVNGSAGTRIKTQVPGRKLVWLLVALASLLVVAPMVLRAFVVEAFSIPSGAMFPTLLVGDHVFISKLGYGCESCIPERGEVFVFRFPGPQGQEPVDYVKRVIALPGDELQLDQGQVTINGWKAPSCGLGALDIVEVEGETHRYRFFVEFLAGHAYLVSLDEAHEEGQQGPYRVGPNEAWVLGDNRNNSSDSRAWNAGRGAGVPFENFHGAVSLVWLPAERFGTAQPRQPRLPIAARALQSKLDDCLKKAPSIADSTPPRP